MEDEYIKDALKYGAMGYLLKNNSPEKLKMLYIRF